MKYVIRRKRPKSYSGTTRISDLRGKEKGTFAMPSGDCSAAAVFCAMVTVEIGLPYIYILMPFVMLGRVYYQCHWLGDTIAGCFVGTFWGILGISNFYAFVPYFQAICGIDAFVVITGNSSEIPQ